MTPSPATLKKNKIRLEEFHKKKFPNTLECPVAPGQSTRCNLVRMETPNEIWLREEERTGPYYKMKQKMSEYFFYREEPVGEASRSPGSCFAIKTQHQGWARVRVLKEDQEKSKVTCLLGDLGEIVEADINDLRQLPEEFLGDGFYAFRTKIPDLFPLGIGGWSRASDIAENNLLSPIIADVRKPVLYSQCHVVFLDHQKRKFLHLHWKPLYRNHGDTGANPARHEAREEV